MDENELKKWERHMGKPEEYDFDGDKFVFSPLPIEYLGNMMFVASKITDNPSEDIMKKASELVVVMLKTSYPDMEEEKLKSFAMKNFPRLMNILWQVNSFESKTIAVRDKIEKARANIAKEGQPAGTAAP